jgi:CspA family cold shock protein
MVEKIDGIVKWFNNDRGYGFVYEEEMDTEEYFVHYSAINVSGYKTLTDGQAVTFALKITDKGTQAIDVTPV